MKIIFPLIIFYFIFSFFDLFFSNYISSYDYMVMNISFDLFIFITYIYILGLRGKYLFPSSLFVFFYYIYSILGKLVWVYREKNWFNESGDPKNMALYFSFIGVFLTIVSVFNLISNFKLNKIKAPYINSLKIQKNQLFIFTILCFIGAFLFTNQFRDIPLLSESMDEARVDAVKSSDGGRGIGFVLLMFGIVANSLALLSLKIIRKQDKIYYYFFIVTNTVLLSLYSGRFLPIMPFVLFFIISKENIKFNTLKILKYLILIFVSFFALMLFGAKRAFGNSVDAELAERFIIADSFPEFRMTVYSQSMPHNSYFAEFFYTYIAGLIPAPFLNIIGIDKSEFFNPIGSQILKLTHYDPIAVPGIRTSLFGELSFTGGFIFIFVGILVLVYYNLDSIFFKLTSTNFKKYRLLSLSIFLAFSIPYGSLFLVSCTHLALILYLLEKNVFKNRLRKM